MNAVRTLTKRLGIEGIGVKGAVRKPTTKKSLAVGYVRPAIRKRLPHKNCCPAPLPLVRGAFFFRRSSVQLGLSPMPWCSVERRSLLVLPLHKKRVAKLDLIMYIKSKETTQQGVER